MSLDCNQVLTDEKSGKDNVFWLLYIMLRHGFRLLHDYCIVNYDRGVWGRCPRKILGPRPFFLGNALSSKINTLFSKTS